MFIDDLRLERIRILEQTYTASKSNLPTLEERIDLLRAVIGDAIRIDGDELAPTGILIRLRHDLSLALYTRFQHIREVKDLDEAHEHLRIASEGSLILSDILFPGTSSILGSVLRERARALEDRQGLEEALLLHRLSLSGESGMSTVEKAHHSRELGLTLRVYYRCASASGDPSHLHESVTRLRDACNLYKEAGVLDVHSMLGLSATLGEFYYIATADESHIEEAVSLARKATMLCDLCSPDVHAARYGLASVLVVIDALDEAITTIREVLHNASLGWAEMLIPVLVFALTRRFRRHGQEKDISESVTLSTAQLARGDSGQNKLVLRYVLALSLFERFRVTGEPEDIEEAIRQANLYLSLPTGGGQRTRGLQMLATCRGEQYGAFGDITHLDECIELCQQIRLSAPSQGYHSRASIGDLLEALYLRCEHLKEKQDMNQAMQLIEEYSPLWEEDGIDSSDSLRNAGNVFLLCFKQTGTIEYLEKATMFHLKTANSDTGGFITNSENLLAYAKTLCTRFEILGERDSVEKALLLQQHVSDTLPETHPNHSRALCGIAHARLCTSSTVNDADHALGYLLSALSNSYCSAFRRMTSAMDILVHLGTEVHPHIHTHHSNAAKLLMAYSITIELLPQVASFGMGPRTRLFVISNAGRLASYSAAHAISLSRVDRAVEMLEAGRGVFWSQSLRLRTQFSHLPSEIGNRLTRITRALGRPLLDSLTGPARDQELGRRRQLGDEFKSILAEARLLPGFENLLRNADFRSLSCAAASHPIVLLVAGDKSSHAILVSKPAEPQLVVLSNVYHSSLQDLSRRLDKCNHHTAGSRGMRKAASEEEAAIEIFEELWKDIMLPIVEALNWTKATGRRRHRLTLCPTGIFMQLPLHAAGIYTGAQQVSCSDFFVTSYTPSIEALLNVQRTMKPIRRTDADTLLVAVHNPFEGSALPMTTEEAATINQLVPSKIVQASCCTDVLDHIRSASILHLACHGSQDPVDALQSGFTLDDGLLTVSKLMELDLPNAFLAVLSACETAKGDATQPDQAIHLAATMLFAGFKSVVATMWYMGDLDGPVIAESIYSSLFNKGDESEFLNPDEVPYALDEAVQKLRNSGLDPSFWATYIHIGV